MKETTNNNTGWLLAIVVIAMFAGGLLSYTIFPNYIPVEGKQQNCQETCKNLIVPCAVYNDSIIKSDILAVKSEVLKDSDWEKLAKTLATNEMKDNDYKDVFNALRKYNISIVDKEDITSVKIDDTDVSDSDTEEQDATVEFDLIVKYENADGSDKKEYLTLVTKILDGDVDDTEYTLTD